jgi:alkylation response protein AidB-like acyl-CoA dehydrogenase
LIPAGGKGFKEIMNEFNSERCGNSAFCVGFAQGAYERTLRYCKERVQFGKPISELQGIRWILAEMAIKIQAARLPRNLQTRWRFGSVTRRFNYMAPMVIQPIMKSSAITEMFAAGQWAGEPPRFA